MSWNSEEWNQWLWKYSNKNFQRWSWGQPEEDVDIHARLFAIREELNKLQKTLDDLIILLLNYQIGEEE